MTTTHDNIAAERAVALEVAVGRIEAAALGHAPCAPVRDVIPDGDIDLAYAIQRELIANRRRHGARVVGRKIGLTSPAVQAQLGVDRPDFGVLLDDMDVTGLDEVPIGRLLQPKIEAEIAFVLGSDLDVDDIDVATARAAVDYAVAALEIVDSRIAGWNITITDTVADNASSGLFVLGTNRVTLAEFEPADVTMTMYEGDRQVSEGTGRACLGDPLNALVWLARTAREYGDPLRAGQLILSGGLGPMAPVSAGSCFGAQISVLGEVSARFSTEQETR